jgi:hypothetical protein
LIKGGLMMGYLTEYSLKLINEKCEKIEIAEALKEKSFNAMEVLSDYLKLIILSGSETDPLLSDPPFFILSTNSIPSITLPKAVYCPSK